MLIRMIKQVGIQVQQANTDVDNLIVSKAFSSALSGKPVVVVVGTDTDLLVMMVSLASEHMDLYMLCGRNPIMLYRNFNIKMRIGENSKLLHPLTSCDTVSALYR